MTDPLPEILTEAARADALHGPFNSLHELYAVLLEEVEEFWLEVKAYKPPRSLYVSETSCPLARKELVQVAAVALRALRDWPGGTSKCG